MKASEAYRLSDSGLEWSEYEPVYDDDPGPILSNAKSHAYRCFGPSKPVKAEDPAPGNLYHLSPYLGFSDYSGSAVERANVRVFMDRHKMPGVVECYGGHGTTAVAIHSSILCEDVPCSVQCEHGIIACEECDRCGDCEECKAQEAREYVREDLVSLQEYPCLDDDELYVIENEAQEEAWESWAEREFREALEKRANATKAEDQDDVDLDKTEADLRQLFMETAERASEYWQIEQGGDAWIDVEKVARAVTDAEIAELVASATDTA